MRHEATPRAFMTTLQRRDVFVKREMCLFIHSRIATGTYRSKNTRKPARLTILVILHTSTYTSN
jgi:hypothetical protein